jgi:hypothetical protein
MPQYPERPIENDLIETACAVDLIVSDVKITPTHEDQAVHIDGRIGDPADDDVAVAAFGVLFALSALSFLDARPRGFSGREYNASDNWTAADLLRHLQYEDGELCLDADYVRGRRMKTRIIVRADGSFTLEAMERGQAPVHWIERLQGKPGLRVVPAPSE